MIKNCKNLNLQIENLLAPYDSSPTECDGMTRICHTILAKNDLQHQTMIGVLLFRQREIKPHFWIDLPSGERIDYRARLWTENIVQVPHGVFYPDDFPEVIYQGKFINLEVLSPEIFLVLAGK